MIWPPRSQLRRKTWYTALALVSAVYLLLPQASPSWAGLADDTPPIVTYSIDGIAGTNNWYRGSTHGNNIIVALVGQRSGVGRPRDDRLRPGHPDPGTEHGNHQDLPGKQ